MCSRNSFWILLIVIILTSCQENDPLFPESERYPGVDQLLWPYFEKFEAAGAERGLAVDLASTGITASIREIHENQVAGQCSYGYANPGEITVDLSFWNRSGNLAREMILFHELGHCYLERDHLEEAFSSGYCTSIMRSGTCCCRDGYNLENRSYYLDELFGVLQPQ